MNVKLQIRNVISASDLLPKRDFFKHNFYNWISKNRTKNTDNGKIN